MIVVMHACSFACTLFYFSSFFRLVLLQVCGGDGDAVYGRHLAASHLMVNATRWFLIAAFELSSNLLL